MFTVTAEGMVLAASLVQDVKFGAGASALLKSAAAKDDVAHDVVEDLQYDDGSGDLPLTTEDCDVSGRMAPLPDLLSAVSKRLNTSAEVTVSRSQMGVVGIEIKLNLTSRELGLQHGPSHDTSAGGLLPLLDDSPYHNVLSGASWIEFPRNQRLPQPWDDIISGCWVETPVLNYATAALFAGCVLFNPQNKKAVLCLVVESYGRGFDTDVHCEKPICTGKSVSSISQPSASSLYPHANVCRVLHDKNDDRLVIGLKTFNVLVTEVWRLDRGCSSERAFTAGSCSGAFPIPGNENVKIFIDKRSLDLASDVVSGRHLPRFGIDLLRQIRSHLCSADSYRMGRASSYLISNMVSAQAASIFTLSLIYPASGDGSMASSLLSRVAKEVNAKGREAVLQKVLVLDTFNRLNHKDKSVGVLLGRILDMYQDKKEISIFDDEKSSDLESLLDSLAESVSSLLYRCNTKVVLPKLTQEMERLS
ncbi:unnamed protein product [Mortierella alpina]